MSESAARPKPRDLRELMTEHTAVFQSCYGGREVPRLFFSPGRVNLFGGHLDYSGGPVMPTAIDRGTFAAARPRADRRVRIASTFDKQGLEFDLAQAPTVKLGRWVDYPLGVLIDLLVRARAVGRDGELCGLEIMYGGNLAVGAGLSSSASICVGTAYLLDRLWSLGLSAQDRVQSALRAERGFVGVQCGIMDPYAVGYARPGHVLWLDCKDESFEHLPLDFDRVSIVIADTGVERELATGEFNLRVEQCGQAFELLRDLAPGATCLRDVPLEALDGVRDRMPVVLSSRAEHVLKEVQRTFAAREALIEGDLGRLGELMHATHRSLRDLYEVSCPELDTLVAAAAECDEAFGARLTGAGFGGCVVVLARRGGEQELIRHLSERFDGRFGRRPTIDVYGGDEGPREI